MFISLGLACRLWWSGGGWLFPPYLCWPSVAILAARAMSDDNMAPARMLLMLAQPSFVYGITQQRWASKLALMTHSFLQQRFQRFVRAIRHEAVCFPFCNDPTPISLSAWYKFEAEFEKHSSRWQACSGFPCAEGVGIHIVGRIVSRFCCSSQDG